jgi:hypothetical protein
MHRETGCSLLATGRDGSYRIGLEPGATLPEDGSMIIVGDIASERRFLARHSRG